MRSQPWPHSAGGQILLLALLTVLTVAPFAAASAQTQPASPTIAATPETVTTEFSPPPEIAVKATAYRNALHQHFFANALYGIVVLLVVLYFRVAPKYRDWAERASRHRFVQVLIFAPLLLLSLFFLTPPPSISEKFLDRLFAPPVKKGGSWGSDWATNQIIALITP